jgi:Flp pilus assembly secretin CpaC
MTRKTKKYYPSNRRSYYSVETTGTGYQVFLNGNPVNRAISADTRRGYVKVISEPVVCSINGNLATHKLRGRVQVRKILQ